LNPVNHQGAALTKIGTIPWARVRIQVPKAKRTGLIQDSFAYLRIGFMYYRDVRGEQGKILVGCDNTDVDTLVNAFKQVVPYNGTPTGPALSQAYEYFRQQNNADYADNSDFIGLGTLIDPYYQADASGVARAVPCRKSFVILLSDGEWNVNPDPDEGAADLHADDIRNDLDGDQKVDIYSIFAFSSDVGGENSMKKIAMLGAFKDSNETACGAANKWPYPTTGNSGDSKDFAWPIAQCDPNYPDCTAGSCTGSRFYNTTCCKEWDVVWDRDNDGVNEDKGVPDTYYKASNGKDLNAALAAVFADVISRHASASAVATVSQEMRSEDIIVRGVFDAADPDHPDTYLWRGHLETFRPFMYNGEEKYSFEFSCNSGRLCLDMPGTDAPCSSFGANCTDAGYILSTGAKLSTWQVFTYDPDSKHQEDFDTSSTYLTEAVDGTTDGVNRLGYHKTSQATDTQNLINWVLGTEETGFRGRTGWKLGDTVQSTPWTLGDIVYSTPVVIGPPGLGEVSRRDPDVSSYYTHRNNNIHRMKVVYVGANDGMLHAFVLGKYDSTNDRWVYDPNETGYSDIGKELWAYIPSNLLTEFRHTYDKGIANTVYGNGGCTHRSMVDLASRSWEVYINPKANRPDLGTNPCGDQADAQGRCWRSVVVGGERGGGDVYFAIDVTDPVNPIVLWEYPVLKNRVVVEVVSSSNPKKCIQDCRNDCASSSNTCWTQRQTCRDACPACVCTKWNRWGQCTKQDCTAQNACLGDCTTAYNTCLATCEGQCEVDCNETSLGQKSFVPFRSVYDSVKMLPLSWSQPYLGRIEIPTSVKFYVGDPAPIDPVNGGDPSTYVQFDADNNRREVAFMGGGIHVYDRDFDPASVREGLKLALFWPYFLMMDIETGNNLFEYVWPKVVNQAWAQFPLKTADVNTIPYAMTDPIALDVWDQNAHMVGDDGFIDRIYVGDMNGYFYGIKFNLAPKKADGSDNTDFGMLVDLWPDKKILKADLDTDYYRSDHQPITVSAAATFESGGTDNLRVIIGAGKYDDVYSSGDDKTDTAKMSIYNLKDKVELPDVSSGYEVYDSSHHTGFKVAVQPQCADVDFNTGCTWVKVSDTSSDADTTTVCSNPDDLSTCAQVSKLASSPDCCQKDNDTCTSPCFACVFDLTLPDETGDPGERVVGKPLIAGGLVFVTTYVPPSDPCGYTGEGYLYLFDVNCTPLVNPQKFIPGTAGTAVGAVTSSGGVAPGGVRVDLGSGIPSKPVLDSRGENVIIQMSDGTLKRFKVDLPLKPIASRGWRAR
jgi:type IV pilus assembly protein PilY1